MTPRPSAKYLNRTAWQRLDEAQATVDLIEHQPQRMPQPGRRPVWKSPPAELDRKAPGREFICFNRGLVGAW